MKHFDINLTKEQYSKDEVEVLLHQVSNQITDRMLNEELIRLTHEAENGHNDAHHPEDFPRYIDQWESLNHPSLSN